MSQAVFTKGVPDLDVQDGEEQHGFSWTVHSRPRTIRY